MRLNPIARRNATLKAQIAELLARIGTLEAKLALDSQNSSKPPSSDPPPPQTPPRSQRSVWGKKRGGQIGHRGTSLSQVATPDSIVVHSPTACATCGAALADAPVIGTQRRQLFDVPEVRVRVTEHQALTKACGCGQHTTAAFPSEVRSLTQYGSRLRATALYLIAAQFVPYDRTAALLHALYGVDISPATLCRIVATSADTLAPVTAQIKAGLTAAPRVHFDETGISVGGTGQWVHSASSPTLTYYGVHPKRGTDATEAIGILPHFEGVAVHDGWASYRRYAVTHALCNAHHLRELTFVTETTRQGWAGRLTRLLRETYREVEAAKAAGQTELTGGRLAAIDARYRQIITAGLEANPPPSGGWPKSERGRPAKGKIRALVERLDRYAADVLRFAHDFGVPFDNNLAEHDLRMLKLQQKVSGCFRSAAGAAAFCTIRSYVSTLVKQGNTAFAALFAAVAGQPLTPVVVC